MWILLGWPTIGLKKVEARAFKKCTSLDTFESVTVREIGDEGELCRRCTKFEGFANITFAVDCGPLVAAFADCRNLQFLRLKMSKEKIGKKGCFVACGKLYAVGDLTQEEEEIVGKVTGHKAGEYEGYDHKRFMDHLIDFGYVVPLDNKKIREAIKLWLIDPQRAKRKYGDIKGWDVSEVTDMRGLLKSKKDFNEDLSEWDFKNVEQMSEMFLGASSFDKTQFSEKPKNKKFTNKNLKWAVQDWSSDSDGAEIFYGPMKDWDVSMVTDMTGLFRGMSGFVEDISKWDVSHVENMQQMFKGATEFACNIGGWDVSKVKNMAVMFSGAKVRHSKHYECQELRKPIQIPVSNAIKCAEVQL